MNKNRAKDKPRSGLLERAGRRVRLRTTFGFPCRQITGAPSALWSGDRLESLGRIGGKELVRATWGDAGTHSVTTWIDKSRLHISTPTDEMRDRHPQPDADKTKDLKNEN